MIIINMIIINDNNDTSSESVHHQPPEQEPSSHLDIIIMSLYHYNIIMQYQMIILSSSYLQSRFITSHPSKSSQPEMTAAMEETIKRIQVKLIIISSCPSISIISISSWSYRWRKQSRGFRSSYHCHVLKYHHEIITSSAHHYHINGARKQSRESKSIWSLIIVIISISYHHGIIISSSLYHHEIIMSSYQWRKPSVTWLLSSTSCWLSSSVMGIILR